MMNLTSATQVTLPLHLEAVDLEDNEPWSLQDFAELLPAQGPTDEAPAPQLAFLLDAPQLQASLWQ